MPTPALRLSPWATPQRNRVQPISRRLVPEPKPCVEVSPTISSQNHSTSRTSSGTFPNREVTFHVPRASFSRRLRLLPSSHCTQPPWRLPRVVSPSKGGPTSCFHARSSPMGTGPASRGLLPGPIPISCSLSSHSSRICSSVRLGGPYQGLKAPGNIALRLIGARNPPPLMVR